MSTISPIAPRVRSPKATSCWQGGAGFGLLSDLPPEDWAISVGSPARQALAESGPGVGPGSSAMPAVRTTVRGQRFTEEQIIAVLKEAEAGAKTPDLCRRYGVSKRAFYRWKARFRGLLRRSRELEDENSRLKHLVADLTLDNQALKELIRNRS